MKDVKSIKTFLAKYLPRDTSTILLAALLGILVSLYNECFFLIQTEFNLDNTTISSIKMFVLIVVFVVALLTYLISIDSQEK